MLRMLNAAPLPKAPLSIYRIYLLFTYMLYNPEVFIEFGS